MKLRGTITNNPDSIDRTDPEEETDFIPLQARVDLGKHSVLVEIRSEQDDLLGEVYVEYYGGNVEVYIWDSEHVGDECLSKDMLVQDPERVIESRQEEPE